MFSKAELKKMGVLICWLQFLLAPYAHAANIPNETEKQTTNNEWSEHSNTSAWLQPGLLNSTRIELKFGSYGVQILAQDPSLGYRLSSLYSEHNNEKISRTIALTQYEANINDKLKTAHEEIIAGGSIGSTLKKYGFDLKKELFFKGLVEDMPDQLQNLMHIQERTFAAVIYNLLAKMENDYYPYCTIIEVYSPDFLTLVEVDQIYPETVTDNINPQHVLHVINDMKQLIMRI